MAKPLKFLIGLFGASTLLGGCASYTAPEPIAFGDKDGSQRAALDARLSLADDKTLLIGEDSFRFDLDQAERRIAGAIVQLVPYDVDQGRSHGKGVGLILIDEMDQQFLLTAAHILYHPQTRQKRAADLVVFGPNPEAPPHILSASTLPQRFAGMTPFLTHMDDIVLVPIESMANLNPLPMESLNQLDLDRRPLIEDSAALSAVSCDFLSENYPTACFAQSFAELEARRLNLYSAVTSDLDVYPGLSGSPVATVSEQGLEIFGVIISGSSRTDCPHYAPPDCYALIGPVTADALEQAQEIEPLQIREEFREQTESDRRESDRKNRRERWWREQ